MLPGKIKGIIDFSGLPKAVEQNSKLSLAWPGQACLHVLRASGPSGEDRSPGAEDGYRDQRDPGRSAPSQPANGEEVGFGDGELRVTIPGLVTARDEPEGGSDLPALSEAARILEREHKGQGGERSHARHLLERVSVWVVHMAEGFDLTVIG